MKANNYLGVILEDIQSKLQMIAETLAPLPGAVSQLQTDVTEIKSDLKVLKAVVTDHSEHINNHETRITRLEAI